MRPSPTEATVFDLDEVLAQVSDAVERAAGEKSLELVVHRSRDIPAMLVGDPQRLGRVLGQLAGNAVKFTERGEVSIAAERESTDTEKHEIVLRISVTDTGAGLDDAIAARFQPGAPDAAPAGFSGTGLADVRETLWAMGSVAEIASAAGIGTDFSFSARFGIAASQRSDTPNYRGLRVLIVDDNDTARLSLQHLLEAAGCRVDAASDGAEALEALSKEDAATLRLMIMDESMPGMDGMETLRCIHGNAQLPHPATILAVAAADCEEAGVRARRLAIPIAGYVNKPISADGLYRALTKVAEHLPVAAPPAPPQTIDRQAALERLGGSEELLGRLLRSFCDTEVDTARKAAESIAAGCIDEAIQRVHRAKGSGMVLGMDRFAAAAAQLEKALRLGADAREMLAPFARELAAAVQACAAEGAAGMSGDCDGEGEPRALPPTGELQPLLESLAALLDRHSMAALDAIEQLAGLLRDTAHGQAVAELESCMQALDFAAATERLHRLSAALPHAAR